MGSVGKEGALGLTRAGGAKSKAVPKFPQYYSKMSQNCLKVVPNCPKVVSKFPQSRPKVVQKLSQISSSYPKWPSFWLPCFDFRLSPRFLAKALRAFAQLRKKTIAITSPQKFDHRSSLTRTKQQNHKKMKGDEQDQQTSR